MSEERRFINKHKEKILEAQQREYPLHTSEKLRWHPDLTSAKKFDTLASKCHPSELSVCRALDTYRHKGNPAPVPEGYHVVDSRRGSVRVPDAIHYGPVPHSFAIRGNIILDYNPAHLMDWGKEPTRPGDKIKELKKRAPDLVIETPDKIVVALCGPIDRIRGETGLSYSISQESEGDYVL